MSRPGPLSEHFQITTPNPYTEADEPWADFKSARKVRGVIESGQKFNQIPTVNLDEVVLNEDGGMPLSLAGRTDVTDNLHNEDLRRGWDPHLTKPDDDQYTGEHVDLFYGEVTGKDDGGDTYTGFAERNNYLDRI
jgi:hypothetical protein